MPERVFDAEGNLISDTGGRVFDSSGKLLSKKRESLKANPPEEVNPVTSFIGESIPIAGAAFAEGPLGFMAGKTIQAKLQQMSPRLFGNPPKNLNEHLQNIVLGAAGNELFNVGASKVSDLVSRMAGQGGIRAKLIKSLTSRPQQEIQAAFGPNDLPISDIPVSASQLTGNPVIGTLEKTAPGVRRELGVEQQRINQEDINKVIGAFGPRDQEAQVSLIRHGLETGQKNLRGEANLHFGRMRELADKNTIFHIDYTPEQVTSKVVTMSGAPITKTVWNPSKPQTVSGPIMPEHSLALANEILGEFKDAYKKKSTAELFDVVDKEYRPLLKNLAQVADAHTFDQNGQAIVKPLSVKAMMDLKSAAGKKGFDLDHVLGKDSQRLFANLNRTLNLDIENGMSQWAIGGQEALSRYRAGNATVALQHELFGRGVPAEKLLTGRDAGFAPTRKILSDPNFWDNAIKGGVDPKVLKAGELTRIFNKTSEDPNKALDLFKQSPVYKKFSAPERADIEHFMKRLQITNSQELIKSGYSSMAWYGGRAAISLSAGAIGGISALAQGKEGGEAIHRGEIFAGGTLLALLSANQFAKAALLNPKVARQAIDLMKNPPNSAAADRARKLIFLGLKGEQINIAKPDGIVVGTGKIDDKGNIVSQ